MRPAADAPPHRESLAGALGILEYMPPHGGRTFIVKRVENEFFYKNKTFPEPLCH